MSSAHVTPVSTYVAVFVGLLVLTGLTYLVALQDFGWMEWEEGRRHAADLGWIGRADLETLCRLFTAHVRNDRFCEGHLAAMWREGVIEAMVGRLRELRDSGL